MKTEGGVFKILLLLIFPHFENYYNPKEMKADKLKSYGILTIMGLGMVCVAALLLLLVQIFLWAAYDIGLPI